MTLNELALKYGSDKSSEGHNYMPFYEEHLPKNPKKILEIGVLKGASIRVWKDYFPEAEIHGLDLFNEHAPPEIDGVKFWKGSQTDPHMLYDLRNNLKADVIIDDGGHNSVDQWVSLMSLIGTCKYYFIEDMHCSEEEFYRQGLKYEQTIPGAIIAGEFPFECVISNDRKIAVIIND
jgi:hypothetical protein